MTKTLLDDTTGYRFDAIGNKVKVTKYMNHMPDLSRQRMKVIAGINFKLDIDAVEVIHG